MTIPALLFAFVIALLIGALFHAIRGGGAGRLFINFGFSILGFALGHVSGMWFELSLYQFGVLELGLGILGSVLFLIAGAWLVRS